MLKSGLVIYAAELNTLVNFYSQVFNLELINSDHSYAELASKEFELVILTTEISRKNLSSTHATPRVSTAIKPVFFISNSMHEFREKIKEYHGHLNDKDSEWTFNNLNVCDGSDPEGNIFQIRSEHTP